MKFVDIIGHRVEILMSNNITVYGKVLEYDPDDRTISIEQYADADSPKIISYKTININSIKMITITDYHAL